MDHTRTVNNKPSECSVPIVLNKTFDQAEKEKSDKGDNLSLHDDTLLETEKKMSNSLLDDEKAGLCPTESNKPTRVSMMETVINVRWMQIVMRFEAAFMKVFAKSKKAHFDCLPREYKVIDGARARWCPLILLDAILYLLHHKEMVMISRRAFNQQRVLYDCILAEVKESNADVYNAMANGDYGDLAEEMWRVFGESAAMTHDVPSMAREPGGENEGLLSSSIDSGVHTVHTANSAITTMESDESDEDDEEEGKALHHHAGSSKTVISSQDRPAKKQLVSRGMLHSTHAFQYGAMSSFFSHPPITAASSDSNMTEALEEERNLLIALNLCLPKFPFLSLCHVDPAWMSIQAFARRSLDDPPSKSKQKFYWIIDYLSNYPLFHQSHSGLNMPEIIRTVVAKCLCYFIMHRKKYGHVLEMSTTESRDTLAGVATVVDEGHLPTPIRYKSTSNHVPQTLAKESSSFTTKPAPLSTSSQEVTSNASHNHNHLSTLSLQSPVSVTASPTLYPMTNKRTALVNGEMKAPKRKYKPRSLTMGKHLCSSLQTLQHNHPKAINHHHQPYTPLPPRPHPVTAMLPPSSSLLSSSTPIPVPSHPTNPPMMPPFNLEQQQCMLDMLWKSAMYHHHHQHHLHHYQDQQQAQPRSEGLRYDGSQVHQQMPSYLYSSLGQASGSPPSPPPSTHHPRRDSPHHYSSPYHHPHKDTALTSNLSLPSNAHGQRSYHPYFESPTPTLPPPDFHHYAQKWAAPSSSSSSSFSAHPNNGLMGSFSKQDLSSSFSGYPQFADSHNSCRQPPPDLTPVHQFDSGSPNLTSLSRNSFKERARTINHDWQSNPTALFDDEPLIPDLATTACDDIHKPK